MDDKLVLDRLKDALPLSRVMGRDHKLIPSGRGRYKLLCPFHKERTPSCHIDDEKGLYYCFGCGASGDVIRYVMQTQNLAFSEALETLAQQAGLAIPVRRAASLSISSGVDGHTREQGSPTSSRSALLNRAAAWFEQQLQQSPHADYVRQYLREVRRIHPESIKTFGLGWAPEEQRPRTENSSANPAHKAVHKDDHLIDAMLKEGFSASLLVDCGLAMARDFRDASEPSESPSTDAIPTSSTSTQDNAHKEAGGSLLPSERSERSLRPFFKQRLIFPIHDRQGRLVAFGGRYMARSELPSARGERGEWDRGWERATPPPKYLNSRSSEDFSKRANLYNLHRARQAARERGGFVVVEGYMDVIALHQVGWQHAVAPLGSAMTNEHWRALWRTERRILLMMDGDAAGQRAAERAIDAALPDLDPTHQVMVLALPSGQDPDDLCRNGGGQALEDAMRYVRSWPDFLWERTLTVHATQSSRWTAETMASIEHTLVTRYAAITDRTLRQHIQRDVSDRLWQKRREMNSTRSSRTARSPGSTGSVVWRYGGAFSAADEIIPQTMPQAGQGRHLRWHILLACLLEQPHLAAEFAERLAVIDPPASLKPLLNGILDFVAKVPPSEFQSSSSPHLTSPREGRTDADHQDHTDGADREGSSQSSEPNLNSNVGITLLDVLQQDHRIDADMLKQLVPWDARAVVMPLKDHSFGDHVKRLSGIVREFFELEHTRAVEDALASPTQRKKRTGEESLSEQSLSERSVDGGAAGRASRRGLASITEEDVPDSTDRVLSWRLVEALQDERERTLRAHRERQRGRPEIGEKE